MTWVLIVAMSFAFPGYATKEDCLAAADAASNATPDGRFKSYLCVPHPKYEMVIGVGQHP